jgi:hypothetical protein
LLLEEQVVPQEMEVQEESVGQTLQEVQEAQREQEELVVLQLLVVL